MLYGNSTPGVGVRIAPAGGGTVTVLSATVTDPRTQVTVLRPTAEAGRDREARATVGAGGQFAPTIHDPLDPSGPLIPFVCLDGRLASDPNSPVRIGVNRGVHAPVAVARVYCLRRAQAGAQLESIASKAGAAPAVFLEDDRLFLDDSASGSISSSAGSSPAGSS